MKKIFYAAVSALLLLGLFSCDLQRDPDGSDNQKDHFASFVETKQFRDGLYATLRGTENPTRFVWQDLQSDMYAVTTNDGNTSSRFITWSLGALESSGEIASYYLAYYSLLQRANYFVTRIERSMELNLYLEKELKDVKIFHAEGKTLQALALSRLMERFAYKYDPAATTHPYDLGIVLVKDYNPMIAAPRNTQKECYDYILECLNQAIDVLPNKSNEGNIRVSKHYAHALRARVNFAMGNYDAAKEDAKVLVDNYPLIDVTTAKNFAKVYRDDANNPEIVFRAFASGTIGTVAETTLSGFLWHSGAQLVVSSPISAPFQWVVDLYDDTDYRKSCYITKDFYVIGGGVDKGYVVGKYLGNPAYQSNPNVPDFKVTSRFFSVAEAYLIMAESMAKSGDAAGAKDLLKTLCEKRGGQLEDGDIMDLVMAERTRELIGEGSRLNDMIRWNLPNNHDDMENQPVFLQIGLAKADKLKQPVPAGHYAFTWEFPVRDRQVNPQIIKNWPN